MTESTGPAPTHLDARDPAAPGRRDIAGEVERELARYPDRAGLVLLVPEDRWAELAGRLGLDPAADEADHAGARLRKAAVSAVVAQDGF